MDGSIDEVSGTGAELSGVVIDGTGVVEESMAQQNRMSSMSAGSVWQFEE